jgi:hypothetical protein
MRYLWCCDPGSIESDNVIKGLSHCTQLEKLNFCNCHNIDPKKFENFTVGGTCVCRFDCFLNCQYLKNSNFIFWKMILLVGKPVEVMIQFQSVTKKQNPISRGHFTTMPDKFFSFQLTHFFFLVLLKSCQWVLRICFCFSDMHKFVKFFEKDQRVYTQRTKSLSSQLSEISSL